MAKTTECYSGLYEEGEEVTYKIADAAKRTTLLRIRAQGNYYECKSISYCDAFILLYETMVILTHTSFTSRAHKPRPPPLTDFLFCCLHLPQYKRDYSNPC